MKNLKLWGYGAAAVALASLVARCGASPKNHEAPQETKQAESPRKTRKCVVAIPGAPEMKVPGFPAETGYEAYGKAAEAGFSDMEMLKVTTAHGGRMVMPQTKCNYTDLGIATSKVLLLDGEFAGEELLFPTEWVRN